MLAIINNIAAYLEHLSASASTKLLQLFALMSSPSFLLANETNHTLLRALLEAMNATIEHQFSSESGSAPSCRYLTENQQQIQLSFSPSCAPKRDLRLFARLRWKVPKPISIGSTGDGRCSPENPRIHGPRGATSAARCTVPPACNRGRTHYRTFPRKAAPLRLERMTIPRRTRPRIVHHRPRILRTPPELRQCHRPSTTLSHCSCGACLRKHEVKCQWGCLHSPDRTVSPISVTLLRPCLRPMRASRPRIIGYVCSDPRSCTYRGRQD